MQRKDLVTSSTGSILLVVPEGNSNQQASRDFLANQHQAGQVIFFNQEEQTLKINQVREILQHLSFARSKSEPQTVVICAAQTATIPAQNSLLKIVEEPPAYTQIVLTVNPGHQLLPTLVSRCREIIWTADSSQAESHIPDLAEQRAALQAKASQVQTFLNDPTQFSYSDLIFLGGELSDLQTAKQVLRLMLQPATLETWPVSTRQALLMALASLEKNGNVKLSLEHLFFTIKAQTA
jgi:hypothetical protein